MTDKSLAHANLPFSLHRDPFGRLVLVDHDGHAHEGVTVIRAFPISDPHRMVSIVDTAGHELALVEDLENVDADTRLTVLQELARREFLPHIQRILGVSGRIEPCEWRVATDRGEHRFVISAYEDVHRFGQHGALVIDGEGTRYLIPDVRQLDRASRRHLERYL
ncbi:MAG: DUF1854 domain-containing protein [Planctomycetia bacterium]|nr:DUF1854 domain-containing protein [Planctomycetia bacterium]